MILEGYSVTPTSQSPIIETKDLTIRFGGHVAVDHVSLQILPNTFKSIIGPNGAGKTTFFNMLSGQYSPTEGKVFFKGRDITPLSPAVRTRLGIGRSFQLTNVFPTLTVLENVRLAVQSQRNTGFNFWKNYLAFPEFEERAYALLEMVLLNTKWDVAASSLTHGEQRKLEIGILLALETEVLLLDEPTAGMSLEEVPSILEILKQIKNRRDKTILLVEHKMDVLMALSDSIAVLHEGKLIADGPPEAISKNQEVQTAYFGGGSSHG
ncbi:MAG: ABC transporter ATP-binding protein [Deltaproteobacteria bacterium]|nr:ABC transporter ATP-binding protein [Deltaproteobacteria bacterium]